MQETLRVRTRRPQEVVDLTREVAAAVSRAAISEGLCNADPGFRLDHDWSRAMGPESGRS